jgi:hypothetical protein
MLFMKTRIVQMKVEIVNYEKYNPRKDQKNYIWFRFNNNFFDQDNKNFYNLSNDERIAWIFLLCQASKQNNSVIEIENEIFTQVTKLDIAVLNSLLNKLLPRSVLISHESVLTKFATERDGTIRNETIRNETIRNEKKEEFPCDKKNMQVDKSPAPKKETCSWLFEIAEQCYAKLYPGSKFLRNARINRQLTQIISECGKELAEKVVLWFFQQPNNYYRSKGHDLKYCIFDLQKLVTECQTKKKILKDPKASILEKEIKFQEQIDEVNELFENEAKNGKSQKSIFDTQTC